MFFSKCPPLSNTSLFPSSDSQPASGLPGPPGDSLPDLAGVCCPAAEGDATDSTRENVFNALVGAGW